MDKDTAAQKYWVIQPSFQIYIVAETKHEFNLVNYWIISMQSLQNSTIRATKTRRIILLFYFYLH